MMSLSQLSVPSLLVATICFFAASHPVVSLSLETSTSSPTTKGLCQDPSSPNCSEHTCPDGTELLEIQGGFDNNQSFAWRVARMATSSNNGTSNSAIVMEYSGRDEFFLQKKCIPQNACYRLIVGTDNPGLHNTFDAFLSGNKLVSYRNLQFETLNFGGNGPHCRNNDNGMEQECLGDESLMEVFVLRSNSILSDAREYPVLSWELLHNTSNDLSLLGKGNITKPELDNEVTYFRLCVPRHNCYKFRISVSEDASLHRQENNNTLGAMDDLARYDYQEEGPYRIVFDRFTFDRRYRLGSDAKLEESIHVGNCLVSDICDVGESLFELSFSTTNNVTSPMQPQWSEDPWFVKFNISSGGSQFEQEMASFQHGTRAYGFYQCLLLNDDVCLKLEGNRVKDIVLGVATIQGSKEVKLETCDSCYFGACGDGLHPQSSPALGQTVIILLAGSALIVSAFVVALRTRDDPGPTRTTSRDDDATDANSISNCGEEEEGGQAEKNAHPTSVAPC